jgi:ABC-type Fe3+ transport system permease subunit
MNDLPKMDDERSVLLWGGLAGILGGIIFILVFVVVIAFVGPDPAEPEGLVKRFPDIRAARTVENSLYLLVLILWVSHFLALYRALRVSDPRDVEKVGPPLT